MEVHHHPNVEKKGFKEYFLEFLMIFLAVTLGFFGENIREHYNEKDNARKYLESYRDELLQQKTIFRNYEKLFQNKVVVCDTLKQIFYSGEENSKLDVIRRLVVRAITLIEVPYNTASYDQMVSSGSLRYINNIALRDSMSFYKGQIETIHDYDTRILQSFVNNTFEISKIQDFHDVVSTDTSRSYDLANHLPGISPFPLLAKEQRGALVFFYAAYIIHAQSDLRRLRILSAINENLIRMVNEQLKK